MPLERGLYIDTELGPGSPGSTSGCLSPNCAAMNKLPNTCTLQFLYLKNGILSRTRHSEFKPLSEGCRQAEMRATRDRMEAFVGLQVDLNLSCPPSLPCLSSKAGQNQRPRDCVVFMASLTGQRVTRCGASRRTRDAFRFLPSFPDPYPHSTLQISSAL